MAAPQGEHEAEPSTEQTAPELDPDRRTLRRALVAGAWTTGVLMVVTVAANTLFGGDGLSAGVWILSTVVVGLLVVSGWMILSVVVDLLAGEVPSTRRIVWTAGLFALAFISPILPAAMLQVAAGR